MNELDEKLADYLTEQAVKILQCDTSAVIWEDDIDEYGFESMSVNQLCVNINKRFSINVNPSIFLEVTSLSALADYLKKYHYATVEAQL
jgi:acyl carrier protein